MNLKRIPALLVALFASQLRAASPPIDLVPGGLSTRKAAQAMTLPAGFTATLFAGEPDVVQPVAFAMDDRGRLWVAENVTYPKRAPEGQGKDRILIFEDTDGDGKFDKRTVFIENLNLVCGLELGFHGVWVGAAPYLLFIPIKPGEDKPAGPPQILLDGFGFQDTHNTLSTFAWGPDGWLYGGQGVGCQSKVGRPGTPENQRQKFNGSIWRYHPTEHLFEIFGEGCTNPWGIDFNDFGQLFVTGCVIPHLWHIVQGGRYQRPFGEPAFPHTYDVIRTIADHRHWAGAESHAGREGYRNAQGQLQTYPADSDAGGGHAHAGGMIYLGDSWPADYRGNIFMFNLHGHRINVDRLERVGSGYVGKHGPDFLLSNDSWSLVLNLQYGPDGSAFMIDFYEKNICHTTRPDFYDRSNGRIYKISYQNAMPTSVDLQKASDEELVKLQLHPNDWFVRHARRILQERYSSFRSSASEKVNLGAQAAEKPAYQASLARILTDNPEVNRKLRALWAVHATGGFSEELGLGLLGHDNEFIRAWSIQFLAEAKNPSDRALKAFAQLARNDRSALVRLYLASALQRMPIVQRQAVLDGLLSHPEDADDHNLPLMYWYALEPLVAQDPARSETLMRKAQIPVLRKFMARRMTELP